MHEYYHDLPSSVRPESLPTDVTFAFAGRPSDLTNGVIDPSAGPVVALPVSDGDVDEVQSLFVVVQRNGVSALQLAVLFGFFAGEVAAGFRSEFPGQNVRPSLSVDLIGTSSWATVESWSVVASAGRGLRLRWVDSDTLLLLEGRPLELLLSWRPLLDHRLLLELLLSWWLLELWLSWLLLELLLWRRGCGWLLRCSLLELLWGWAVERWPIGTRRRPSVVPKDVSDIVKEALWLGTDAGQGQASHQRNREQPHRFYLQGRQFLTE